MTIKTKLRLGLGLLFAMILTLSLLAARYIYILKNDTREILRDNYASIDFVRQMLLALDRPTGDQNAQRLFENNLKNQLANVTEAGESEITRKISQHFNQLRVQPGDTLLPVTIRHELSELTRINMQAIQTKSDKAMQTVQSAFLWIAVSGTFCFIIALTLLVNLPGNIGNPIRELTESIKAIAARRYAERLHFPNKDEFGELAASFNIMAERLEEYDNSNLAQILIEKKRIETLIDNMHEPVIGLDENRQILFANEEAVRITGLSLKEMLGKSAAELAVTHDLMRELTREKGGQPGRKSSAPLKIFADNKESYFEQEVVDITIVPTGERNKKLIGQVILLKNITPFKELDFAKTNFIATVSHELKTPISSIKMSLQLMENPQVGQLNEEQMQLLTSIREDSDRLLKITGELLNMSQVETGNIQLNMQRTDPADILKYAIDATNAIRYSAEGSKLRIRIAAQGQAVRFSVQDEGEGIDSRYQDRIFDRYFQVPGSAKMGTGLGLAISKEFIEAQAGRIGVNSEPGAGSSFYFDLPAYYA
jgi:two-component system, NtrC family, sensor histidine kinase KinB